MKRADIQGMRAVAVIFVLLFHFETRIKGGYLGVDMFFVISGFVIASSTLREIDSTNAFSWRSFLHRRVRRLLPGTALVVVTTAALSMLLLSPFGPQKESAKMLLGAATYSSNFMLMPQSYFSLDPKANPLLHMWSLAVEEQFYFVWPIAIIVLSGLQRKTQQQVFKVIVWTVTTVVLLASCWLFLMSATRGSQVNDYGWFRPLIQQNITPEHFAFYSPFTRAWEFIAGVVVALLLRRRIATQFLKAGALIGCCGAALVIFGVAWASRFPQVEHQGSWSTNTSATITVVIGTAVWIFGVLQGKYPQRLISCRPLVLIGDYSYSIYLLHWPIWVLLVTLFDQSWKTMVIAFALSFVFGWLQYLFIEEPIRTKKRLSSTSTRQFVGVFSLVAVVGFTAMSYTTPVIAKQLTGKNPGEVFSHIIEQPCVGERFELESAQSCVFSSSDNRGTAVLVGDSMAKSLSEGFVQAANSESLSGYIFSFPGCSFQLSDSRFTATNECAAWRADVLKAMQQLQPKVLMIANLHSHYVDPPLLEQSIEDTQLIWGSELKRTVEALSVLQTKIVIAHPPPKFAYDLRYDISLVKQNSIKEARNVVVSRRKSLNEIEQIAISGFEYVQPIVEFTDLFCNAEICDPRVNNKLMFEDTDHLSVEGSKYVSPQIRAAIGRALGL